MDLIADLGRALIGDANNQGVVFSPRRSLLTQSKQGGAGRVRDGIGLPHILVAISQSMEGKKVQLSVRNKNQMLRIQQWAQRLNYFLVEALQVTQSGAKQGLFEFLRVAGIHPKLRELEPEQLQAMGNLRHPAQGFDFNILPGDHRGH